MSATRGRPPMHPLQIRDFLAGTFEDYEISTADGELVIPADRFWDLALSVSESWIKDRQRAIAEAKEVPF